MVTQIKNAGANVVFTQKELMILHNTTWLKKNHCGEKSKKSDMDALARATGASIVTSIKELNSKDLGYAGKVLERKIAGDNMVFVEG